jgi:hypothetical protein
VPSARGCTDKGFWSRYGWQWVSHADIVPDACQGPSPGRDSWSIVRLHSKVWRGSRGQSRKGRG